MIVALPVCAKDLHLAMLNMAVCQKLDQSIDAKCVVLCELSFKPSVLDLVAAASKVFTKVSVETYPGCQYPPQWPGPQNWAWRNAALILSRFGQPWFWWEQDAVPCQRGWVDRIREAYNLGKKDFGGFVVHNNGRPYLAGVAVYPSNTSETCINALIARNAGFDQVGSYQDGVLSRTTDLSDIIFHDFHADGKGRVWAPSDNLPDYAIWHRCEDGSLQRLILDGPTKKAKPVVKVGDATSKVTVVITNFQRPDHLRACFQSCQQAKVANLVVSSSGATPEVKRIHKWISTLMPSAVITSRDDDAGCNEMWLRGAKAARTPKVHLLHDDDWLLPSFERVVAGEFDKYDVVHWDGAKHVNGKPIDGVYVTRDDLGEGEYPTTYLFPFLLRPAGFTLSPVGGVFPRNHVLDVLKECQNKFDSRFYLRPTMMVGNDLLLWLRACQKFSTFYYTHDPLISYGHWEGSASYDDVSHNRFGLLPIYKATRDYFLKSQPRILHVVQRYPFRDKEDQRRFHQAQETWELAYSLGLVYARPQWLWSRDSSSWGDKRQTPFIRDVLKQAAEEAGPGDYVALTNDDTLANIFLWFHALHDLKTKPAVTSFRRNVVKADDVDYIHYPTVPAGKQHCGRDAFFFTKAWIRDNVDKLPDYVMTYCDWDSTLDMLIRLSVGNKPAAHEFLQEHSASNLPTRFVYHEEHDAFWSTGEVRHKHPCNVRCRKLTDEWFAKNLGWPMPDLTPKS